MLRQALLFPLFLLMQAVSQPAPVSGVEGFLERWGMPGAALALIAILWQKDQAARIAAQKASEERYAALVAAQLATIEKNTAANVALKDALSGGVTDCPLAGLGPEAHDVLQQFLVERAKKMAKEMNPHVAL